jgi:hypothetical protein
MHARLGKRVHPQVGEALVGGPKQLARVDVAAFTPQPLAVEQVRTGEIDRHARSTESVDCCGIEFLGQ